MAQSSLARSDFVARALRFNPLNTPESDNGRVQQQIREKLTMAGKSDAAAVMTPNPEVFARELTELSRKHGLALAGTPELFIMQYDDYALEYGVDDNGRLVLS